MNRRSILNMGLLVLLVTGFLYYEVILYPAMTRQKRLIRRIEKRKADLVQMKAVKAAWEGFKQRRREAERRLLQKGAAFSLLAFLEDVAGTVGLEIQYMKPLSLTDVEGVIKTEGIEMGLDHVKMSELIRFLHRIEYSGKLLCINRIKIQKAPQDITLKITLQITSYSRN